MNHEENIKEISKLFQEIKLEILKIENENEKLKQELEMYKAMYNNLSDLVYKSEGKRR